MRPTLIIIILLLFAGCVGLDYDKISDEVVYEPEIALPVGYFGYQFNNAHELPGDIPPIGDLTPVDVLLRDTLFFSLGGSSGLEDYNIQVIYLHYDIVNRYPAKGIMRLFYASGSGTVVEITPSGGIEVDEAIIDENGIITKESKETSFIDVTEHIDGLLSADQMIIELEVNDLVLTNVIRLNFNKYSIQTSLGVRVELKFEN